jgi:hypothetical protein
MATLEDVLLEPEDKLGLSHKGAILRLFGGWLAYFAILALAAACEAIASLESRDSIEEVIIY